MFRHGIGMKNSRLPVIWVILFKSLLNTIYCTLSLVFGINTFKIYLHYLVDIEMVVGSG